MTTARLNGWVPHFLAVLIAAGGMTLLLSSTDAQGDPQKNREPKSKAEKKAESDAESKSKRKIRWGKRRNETDAQYDKRYAGIMRKIKKDKADDKSGGPVPLWTYMGYPFIVRTDIDAEFTADTVMYMEMLHREYGAAYSKLLSGKTPKIIEPYEVVVFESRDTYMKNGGSPGSGGQFAQTIRFPDRGPYWKAVHYRLSQFTSGIKDFAKWEKGTLKHEAAHMELQMRLGLFVDSPRWWNEGHAAVLEWWDFDKTIDENFAEIPNRGRYAPFIRRIFDTDAWKDFQYIWTIDPQTWHRDMTSRQGYLNYCEAWSLAGYMMNEGKKGRADFMKIFSLSLRVGADRKLNSLGTKTRAWEDAFPDEDRKALEKNWTAWVAKHYARDKQIPGEEAFLLKQGINPEITDKIVPLTEEEQKKLKKKIDALEREEKEKIQR